MLFNKLRGAEALSVIFWNWGWDSPPGFNIIRVTIELVLSGPTPFLKNNIKRKL